MNRNDAAPSSTPTDDVDAGDIAHLRTGLGAHLDANMLGARELDADLALVLAGSARRRSLLVGVGVPSALAAAALALFVVIRAPAAAPESAPPRAHDDDVEIYIADAGDPSSAIVIDISVRTTRTGVTP